MSAEIFAERCNALMKAQRLSQADVCRYIDKSHGYLSPHLAGRSYPTIADADGIARCLGTHPNYLLGWSDNPNRDAPPQLDDAIYQIAQTLTSIAQYEAEERPSIERMSYLYLKGGGHYEAFEPLVRFFDMFLPPSESATPVVVWSGEESLSTIAIGRRGMSNNAPYLQKKLDEEATPAILGEMTEAHALAEERGDHSSLREMDLPTRDGIIKFDYKRELYLIRRGSKPLILSFCKAIG
jgi:transcriptional regulator with XRE-family HTH domain